MDYEQLLIAVNHRCDIPKLLDTLGLNGLGAEVGVKCADYSAYILRHSKLSVLYSIDFWDHPKTSVLDNLITYSQSTLRLFKYPDRSVILRMDHKKAAGLIQDGSLDFVYYDIGYNFDTVKEGIDIWWPKVARGGLFCGHIFSQIVLEDGSHKPTTVAKDALNEFLDDVELSAHITTEVPGRGTNSWIVRKPIDL
jgi:hypothetical protein